MELFLLKGTHVLTGKEFAAVFLLRRRKNQRPIDVILDVYDLGGVHVTSVTRVPARKLPKAIAVQIVGAASIVPRR